MGSSKKITVGYRYSMGLHMGLAHTCDALLGIAIGDRTAWVGLANTTGPIAIDAPSLFGGDEREGGVQGVCDVMLGGEDQEPNAYLAEHQGVPQPAYRGFTGLVFRGLVASNNPYIKNWACQVRSILAGWHGGEAWYPERAAIPLGRLAAAARNWRWLSVPLSDTTDYSDPDLDDSAWQVGRPPFASGPWEHPTVYGFSGVPATEVPPARIVWMRARLPFAAMPEDARFQAFVDNDARLYVNGQDVLYVGDTNGAYYDVPLPTGAFVVGENAIAVSGRDWHTGWPPQNWFWFDWRIDDGRDRRGMNPAHIIYQALTDPDWGMGYPADTIDVDSFTAAADQLFDEGLGLCLKWNNQSTIQEFTQVVADHASLVYGQDRRTGKFRMRLLRHDYNEADLPVFTRHDVTVVRYQRPGLADTVNEVVVEYVEAETGKEATTTPMQNLANIQGQGRVVSQTLSFPGLPNNDLASRVAMRELRARSTPLWRFSIEAKRRLAALLPGEPFVLDLLDTEIGVRLVVRAGEIDYGQTAAGVVRAECVEDVFAMPDTTYAANPGTGGQVPDTAPQAGPSAVFEVPYVELAATVASAELAALPDDAGYVGAVALRPAGVPLNFSLYTRLVGGEYDSAGTGDYAPGGALADPIDDDPESRTLTLASATRLAQLEVGSAAFLGTGATAELVRIDAVDLGSLTVEVGRGCGDTLPRAWPAGTLLYGVGVEAVADPQQYVDGEEVEAKVVNRTSSGELPMDQATTHSLELASRQARPYPPADLLLNGERHPADLVGDVELTFAHRDRVLQADTLVDATEASIGPEPGTTYTALIYDREDDSLVHTETGITASPHVLTADLFPTLSRLELFAVRDGLASWQRQRRDFVMGFEISADLGVAPIGVAYSGSITANGATAPVTWTITAGSLPPGLSLGTPSGGTVPVVGTATTGGAYYFTVEGTDAEARTFSADLVLEVGEVRSLLHFDGADGATTITDARPGVAWTRTGTVSAKLTAAQKRFGSSSAEFLDTTRLSSFVGPSDLITAPANAFAPFTIQAWVNLPYLQGTGPSNLPIEWQVVVSQGRAVANGEEMLALRNGRVAFWRGWGVGTPVDMMGTTVVEVDTWNLLELGWDGSTFYLFLNGHLEATAASAEGWYNWGTPVRLGLASLAGWESWALAMRGYQDELRIIRGACLHTADYPLPDHPFADQA